MEKEVKKQENQFDSILRKFDDELLIMDQTADRINLLKDKFYPFDPMNAPDNPKEEGIIGELNLRLARLRVLNDLLVKIADDMRFLVG